MIDSSVDVREDPSSPVTADLVTEFLTVSSGPSRIEKEHPITRVRDHLGVPAIVKVITERSLRTSMDEHHERNPLSRRTRRRFHEESVHAIAVGAFEPEVLRRTEALDARIIRAHGGQSRVFSRGRTPPIQLTGRCHGLEHDEEVPPGKLIHETGETSLNQRDGRQPLESHPVYGPSSPIIRVEEEGGAIS